MGGWDDIVSAAHELETVVLNYTKKNGDVVSHEIFPYSLRGNCLCGHDVVDGHIKKFLVGNINSVERTGNKFQPTYPVEL